MSLRHLLPREPQASRSLLPGRAGISRIDSRHLCSRTANRGTLHFGFRALSPIILHRLLSFFLLAAVVVGYGGVGSYLHERFAHGDFGASTINGGASAGRPVHPVEP